MKISLVLHNLLSLFRGKNDKFLVLEIYENDNRAASIGANFDKKEIKVLKIAGHPVLKKLLKKFGRLSKYKIIVGLDSHLASTIYSSVVLVRDNYKELIDEPELDNLISQAIWKFFDRSRSKVAGKMGVTDLDILLTDVRIRGIKLDGHKVVNPVSFKAKTVEVQFSQTFLSRSVIDSFKDVLPLNQVVLMSENGTAWSSVVAKANLQNNFLLTALFGNKTLFFLADGGQHSYWDTLNWGEENLKRSLATDLALDSETAGAIIGRYINKEASPVFLRRVEVLIAKELRVLAEGLHLALKKTDTQLAYLHPLFDLPAVFATNFRNQFGRSIELAQLPLDLISQNFGFDVKFKNAADARHSFTILASLIEWYLAPQDDRMSQLAKRRVRWLSPL